MNNLKEATLYTLQKAQSLLDQITNEQLCDKSIPPYFSSIGGHLRHVLDFYDCVLKITPDCIIDLTERSRDINVESNCDCAKSYVERITEAVSDLDNTEDMPVVVIDDLGLGKIQIPYTFGAVLAQANTHATHHFAMINYMLQNLNVVFSDADFGYNPTTPKRN